MNDPGVGLVKYAVAEDFMSLEEFDLFANSTSIPSGHPLQDLFGEVRLILVNAAYEEGLPTAEEWAALMQAYPKEDADPSEDIPAQGKLFSLKRSAIPRGVWAPPCVLIVEEPDADNGSVDVAPGWGWPMFASPDDLLLNNWFFAVGETHAMPITWLDNCYNSLSPDELRAVSASRRDFREFFGPQRAWEFESVRQFQSYKRLAASEFRKHALVEVLIQ